MKTIKLLSLFIVLSSITLFAGKIKEVYTWTLNNDTFDNYKCDKSGNLILDKLDDTGVLSVSLYKKDKKIGGGTILPPANILLNDCIFIYDYLNFKTILVKMSNGSNVYFKLFKIGSSIEEIETFEVLSGNLSGICCPNLYDFKNGKWFGFKQRHDANDPNTVKYVILDKKLKPKKTWEIQTPPYYCSDYSPNGIYIYATVGMSNDQVVVEIYKNNKKMTKIVSDFRCDWTPLHFFGEKDNFIFIENDDTNIVWQVKPLKQLYAFIYDDTIEEIRYSNNGDVAILYTNNTVGVITKKGTVLGPFAVPEIVDGASKGIIDFNKNNVIIEINKGNGNYNYYGYKVTKKGLKKFKDSIEFIGLDNMHKVIYDKYIVIRETVASITKVNVYTKKLKKVGTITCAGNRNPKMGYEYFIDVNDDGSNTTLKLYAW